MKKTTQREHPRSLQKILFGSPKRILFDVIVILCICGFLGLVFLYFTHNFARDEAMPIEKELLAAGAVKVCERGDAGRGPDSFRASYEGRYKLHMQKDKAIELIKKIAKNNSYNVSTVKTPYDYILHLPSSTSKQVSYIGFSGSKPSFAIYSGGNKITCPNKSFDTPSDHDLVIVFSMILSD